MDSGQKTSPMSKRKKIKIFLSFFLFTVHWALSASHLGAEPPQLKESPSLWDIHRTLSQKKFIDLTHAFQEGIPHWEGFPDEKRKTIFTYKKHGFWAERYSFAGQWGTHVDPPAHFHPSLRTVDEIPVNEMVAPMVVLNFSTRAAADPDVLLQVEDVKAWESKYGRIPEGSFVAMRTDWSKRWPVMELMQNMDSRDVMHYPGWSVEALRFLVHERKVIGIGHETTDTDSGTEVSADRYSAETYILGENKYQIELLTNLNQVPEYGALAVIAFPKPKRGSGFPARVFAIVP